MWHQPFIEWTFETVIPIVLTAVIWAAILIACVPILALLLGAAAFLLEKYEQWQMLRR